MRLIDDDFHCASAADGIPLAFGWKTLIFSRSRSEAMGKVFDPQNVIFVTMAVIFQDTSKELLFIVRFKLEDDRADAGGSVKNSWRKRRSSSAS